MYAFYYYYSFFVFLLSQEMIRVREKNDMNNEQGELSGYG